MKIKYYSKTVLVVLATTGFENQAYPYRYNSIYLWQRCVFLYFNHILKGKGDKMKNVLKHKKRNMSIMVVIAILLTLLVFTQTSATPPMDVSGPPTEVRTPLPAVYNSSTGIVEVTFDVTPGQGFSSNTLFCLTDYSTNQIYKPTNKGNISRTAIRFFEDGYGNVFPALFANRTDAIYDAEFHMAIGSKYSFRVIIDFNSGTNSLFLKAFNATEYIAIALNEGFFFNTGNPNFDTLPSGKKINVVFSDHVSFPWENMTIKDMTHTLSATLADGTYNSAKQVYLNCSTSAQIYYTLDGSIPNKTSTLYTLGSPISITSRKSLKAVAYVGDTISSVLEREYDVVYYHNGVYGTDKYVKQGNNTAIVFNNAISQAANGTGDENAVTIYPFGKTYSGNVLIQFDLQVDEPYGDFSIGFGEYNSAAPGDNQTVIANLGNYMRRYANIFYRPVLGVVGQSFNFRSDFTPEIGSINGEVEAEGVGHYYFQRVRFTDGSNMSQKHSVKVYVDTANNEYSYWVNGSLVANRATPLYSALENVGVMAINSRYNNILIENFTVQNATINTTAEVVASVPSGSYFSEQTITLSSATAGNILYSINEGAYRTYNPSIPIAINQNTVLKALVFKSDYQSEVSKYTYNFSNTSDAMERNSILDSGANHSIVLKNNGSVWTFGDNNSGKLGNGTTTASSTPVSVNGLSNIISVQAGANHNLALDSSGDVWAWGKNNLGQLGDNTTTNKSTAVKISGLSDVVYIYADGDVSMAVKSNGTVWAWGNNNPKLGTSDTAAYIKIPKAVTGLTNIVMLNKNIALDTTGVLKVFGGTNNSAVPVVGLLDMIFIAEDYAIKADGTVWSWNKANMPVAGGKITITPIVVEGMEAAVWASGDVVVKSDGSLWKLVADASVLGKKNAAPFAGIKDVAYIEKNGSQNYLFAEEDGDVWALGYNNYGQFGNGTTNTGIVSSPAKSLININTDNRLSGIGGSGREFNVISTVTNKTNAKNKTYTLTYDSALVELVDVSYQNFSQSVVAGVYGNVSVISVSPGEIKYKLVSTTGTWTGVVNVFRFKAISNEKAIFTITEA